MSVANGFSRMEGEAVTALRRCVANVITAVTVLTRPARTGAPGLWPLTLRDSVNRGRLMRWRDSAIDVDH